MHDNNLVHEDLEFGISADAKEGEMSNLIGARDTDMIVEEDDGLIVENFENNTTAIGILTSSNEGEVISWIDARDTDIIIK